MRNPRPLLAEIPNYTSALAVSEVHVSELTVERFEQEYVNRMRPVLVREALKHWPAFTKWKSHDHLRMRLGNPDINVGVYPGIQTPFDTPEHAEHQKGWLRRTTFEQFLDEVSSPQCGHRELFDDFVAPSVLAPLGDEVLGFSFVRGAPPTRICPQRRAFLYRNTYTDWHYHQTDETLMAQVVGQKETLLLPPDARTFRAMRRVQAERGYWWDLNKKEEYPAYFELTPLRATVRAGDALYIPTLWWHAVEDSIDAFGITVPWCWGTPVRLFDPRLPGVRQLMREYLPTRAAPIVVGAALWSVVSGALHGRFRRSVFDAEAIYGSSRSVA